MKWLTVEEHGECLELPVWKHPGEKGLYVWTSPSMASWAETDRAHEETQRQRFTDKVGYFVGEELVEDVIASFGSLLRDHTRFL